MAEEMDDFRKFFLLNSIIQLFPLTFIALSLTTYRFQNVDDQLNDRTLQIIDSFFMNIGLTNLAWLFCVMEYLATALIYLMINYRDELPFIDLVDEYMNYAPTFKTENEMWMNLSIMLGFLHLLPMIVLLVIMVSDPPLTHPVNIEQLSANRIFRDTVLSWQIKTVRILDTHLMRLENSERILVYAVHDPGRTLFTQNKEGDTTTKIYYYPSVGQEPIAMLNPGIDMRQLERLFDQDE